jgi:two-component system, OmpR family, flagellar system response regulator FtcR
MIVIVEDRELVKEAFASRFGKEGIPAAGFCPSDFGDWVNCADEKDIDAVEAFLIGSCSGRDSLTRKIRRRSAAAVIAMADNRSLEETLTLFGAGADDVVAKPVHVRELMARIAAIGRRRLELGGSDAPADIVMFADGRDPEVAGEPLRLPRRERRILEYLFANRGRRVTKAQIFNSVYGLFDQEIDENVIESHISKLRKRLRSRLNYDPIDSQRHLGYCLNIL